MTKSKAGQIFSMDDAEFNQAVASASREDLQVWCAYAHGYINETRRQREAGVIE